jgi:hypothetical protein
MNQTELWVVIIGVTLSGGILRASDVEQSQETHSLYNDWGNGTGQTFRPAINGLLTGLEVVIENNNNPGTIEVYLWRADPTGKPAGPKLATGYLDRTNVISPTPAWYTVPFEEPYPQSAGEYLAFTIFLRTSGASGWNEYGYVNTDTDTNGFRILYDPPWSPGYFSASPGSDWAFRTLVIPAPRLLFTKTHSTSLTLSTPTSEPDAEYILQICTNLAGHVWSNIATNTGEGGSLIWGLPVQSDGQSCFRLNVRNHE